MVEDLLEIFLKEFQKYNITGVCVLASYLINIFRILKLLKDF